MTSVPADNGEAAESTSDKEKIEKLKSRFNTCHEEWVRDDELVKMLEHADVKAEKEVRWLSVPTPYHVTVVSKHNERHLWTTFWGTHSSAHILWDRPGIPRFLSCSALRQCNSPVLAIVSGSTSADERRQAQGSLDRRLGAAWTLTAANGPTASRCESARRSLRFKRRIRRVSHSRKRSPWPSRTYRKRRRACGSSHVTVRVAFARRKVDHARR